MANSKEKAKNETPYELRGIPVHAYLIETGEFRWTPTKQACSNKEGAERMLQVLRQLPEDRRAVWASRLDSEQAKARCPVIREQSDLCGEFDAFCSAYDQSPKKESKQERKGGEQKNE